MERLQKIISNSGIASRRKAEELIKEGRVKVDGVVVTELGTKVSKKNIVEVDNVKIGTEEKVYYLLNKPRGVVTTTSDEHGRKTVVSLIETDKRIYPVGRLDYDTTGLILLTNDGEFTNNITHPKNKIDKTYVAKINGILTIADIMALKKVVMIDNFNLLLFLSIMLLLTKLFNYYKDIDIIWNKFLFERYLYKIKYKKIKKINNISKMFKEKTHVLFINNNIIKEKDFLSKMFDRRKNL